MLTQIILRNDISANWNVNNSLLGKGEIGIESDTSKLKIGTGLDPWNTLRYSGYYDLNSLNAYSKDDVNTLLSNKANTTDVANDITIINTAISDISGIMLDKASINNTNLIGITTLENLKLSNLSTAPLSATDVGTIGEIRITTDFIYVCINVNTWVRTSLTTW